MLPPPASPPPLPPPLPPPDADLERGSIYAASSTCETGSSAIAQDQPDSLPESFQKLYKGSSLSMASINCCFMKLAIKHKFMYAAMDYLLNLFAYICPMPNFVPTSIYLLKKFFNQYEEDPKTVLFCNKCHRIKDVCKCKNSENIGYIIRVPVEKP